VAIPRPKRPHFSGNWFPTGRPLLLVAISPTRPEHGERAYVRVATAKDNPALRRYGRGR